MTSILPEGVRGAALGTMLMCRGIDDIEDAHHLPPRIRVGLLRLVSRRLQASEPALDDALAGHDLPEHSRRLDDWSALIPGDIRPRVFETTGAMAHRMADWLEAGHHIDDQDALERYVYCVSGSLFVLTSDVLAWFDGSHTDRRDAVGYGRWIQLANIYIHRTADLEHGSDFYPRGWTDDMVLDLARSQRGAVDRWVGSLSSPRIRAAFRGYADWYRRRVDAVAAGLDYNDLTTSDLAEVMARALATETAESGRP